MIIEKLDDLSLFTISQRDVVTYIKENIETIPLLSIKELSSQTYSSNATIIRICKILGFKGFKEFKVQLVRELENSKYNHQTIDFSQPFYTGESVFDIMNNMSTLYKESIQVIHSQLNPEDFKHFTQTILQSKRIFLYGFGDSELTIKNFMNKLLKINIYPILATEHNEERHISKNLNENDCVIFVSYSGYNPSLIQCLPDIQKSHCHFLVITANEKSPLLPLSNHSILFPNKENDQKIATFYSQLAFHYIFSLLYSLIYAKTKH